MLILFFGWLILYFITTIAGFGFFQLSRVGTSGTISQPEIVLAGLTSLVLITQLTSIFWPTDFRMAGALLLAAGGLNWRLGNRPVRAAVASLRRVVRLPLVWVVAGVILLFSICIPAYYDSGLYHEPSIRWYERFRAIPGLGNLHGRLAFNSSFFVLSAAFGFTALAGQTLFVLNGFTLLFFCIYLITRIYRPTGSPGLRVLMVGLLFLSAYYLLLPVSSPTPDLWATLLPLLVFLLWLDETPYNRPARFMLSVALVLLCLTVKLGTVPLLLFLPILLLEYRPLLHYRQGLRLLALGGLLVGPWLIRNVILSGYLLYPFPAIDLFAVDWKIPLPVVHHEEDYVTFWARFHIDEWSLNPAMLTWPLVRWVPNWWHMQGEPRTFNYFILNRPLFVAAGLSPLVMIVQVVRPGWPQTRLWVAYSVALAGFLFWFLKAPEFRFGLAFLWMAALLPWVPLLDWLPLAKYSRRAIWLPGLLMIYLSGRLLYQKNPLSTRSLAIPNWYGYREAMKKEGVRYQSYQTQSGLRVLIPIAHYFEQRCFEIEQPCSPYYLGTLDRRGPAIEDGYRQAPLQKPPVPSLSYPHFN